MFSSSIFVFDKKTESGWFSLIKTLRTLTIEAFPMPQQFQAKALMARIGLDNLFI